MSVPCLSEIGGTPNVHDDRRRRSAKPSIKIAGEIEGRVCAMTIHLGRAFGAPAANRCYRRFFLKYS